MENCISETLKSCFIQLEKPFKLHNSFTERTIYMKCKVACIEHSSVLFLLFVTKRLFGFKGGRFVFQSKWEKFISECFFKFERVFEYIFQYLHRFHLLYTMLREPEENHSIEAKYCSYSISFVHVKLPQEKNCKFMRNCYLLQIQLESI